MSTQNPGSPTGEPEPWRPPEGQQPASDLPAWQPPAPQGGAEPPVAPGGAEQQADAGPRPGRVSRQEAGVTRPRPPTVAEARARDKARKQAEAAERAAAAAAEAKKRTRKRVMIGGVAVVGVAALVGGGYLAYRALTAPDQVTASCIQVDQNGQEIVVPDDQCNSANPRFVGDNSGGHGNLIILGWPQYRYYYGGTTTLGKAPTGGTTVAPRNATVKTKSGTTIQRGGLGSSSKGGSSS
ncbi:hypothetical protein ACWEVD_30640 [Nocardia thailandica]